MSVKNTQEYVDNYFKEQNWKNFSIYINGSEKLNVECPIGHLCKISFNKFQQGNRCAKCSKKERYSHEYVNKYIHDQGWINNSIFKTVKTKLNIVCPNGHNQEKTFDKFRQGQRCQTCFYNNNVGKNNSCYKLDRTRKKRLKYLQFSYYHINILKDDPLFQKFLYEKENLNNNSNIYSIDHIFPRVAFINNNLDNIYDDIVVKKICNLRENLRIVTKEYNTFKSGLYNQNKFINWFNIQMLKEHNFYF